MHTNPHHNQKHGHSRTLVPRTRTYIAWKNMKARCGPSNKRDWGNYGGRGIFVCPEWADSFVAFLADMGECPEGLTLDRIDTDGNYQKGNCRWVTPSENCNNRRITLTVEINGKLVPFKKACELNGVKYKTAHLRYRTGMSKDLAVSTPTRYGRKLRQV